MRVLKCALSVAVLLSMTQASQAIHMVWFEAVPASGNASVTGSGPGQKLLLSCGIPPGGVGRCEWDVSIRLQSDANLTAWAMDVRNNAADAARVNAKSPNAYGNFGGTSAVVALNPNATTLIGNAGQGNLGGVAAGTYTLYTFRLSKNKDAGDLQFLTPVFAQVGSAEWGGDPDADGDGYPDAIQFGDNNPVSGAAGGILPNPVIEIRNIPEPATMGLLLLGVTGLIRRRAR